MTIATPRDHAAVRTALEKLLAQRIVVFDGSMGALLQSHGLDEDGYRGERFRDHPESVINNTDLLCLTRPDLVLEAHRAYLAAGADILETNSFTGTSVSQADYGLADLS